MLTVSSSSSDSVSVSEPEDATSSSLLGAGFILDQFRE